MKVARDSKYGPAPKLYRYDGEMLTLRQISERRGATVKTLQKRVRSGLPLELPPRKSRTWCAEYNGHQMRPSEIAPLVGVRASVVIRRIARGEQIDAPPAPGEEYVPPKDKRHLAREFTGNIMRDDRPYIFDESARHVMRYLDNAEVVSSDEDLRAGVAEWIAEEFGPDAKLSDEGVELVRQWLRDDMFARGVGRAHALEFVGDLMAVCRERIRQIEMLASVNFRRSARHLGLVEDITRELRELATLRRETWAERMDLIAPGCIEHGSYSRKRKRGQEAAE